MTMMTPLPMLLENSVELESLKDERLEECFVWICITLFLFDAIVFSKMESWSGPIVIGAIQLILLVVLAKRLGIQEISQILAKFLDRAASATDAASPPPASLPPSTLLATAEQPSQSAIDNQSQKA